MSEPSAQNGELALSASSVGRIRRDPVGDGHRLVAVLDADMDLGAADQLFAGEQLIVREHLPISRGLGDLHLGGDRERNRTRGNHADAELRRSIDEHSRWRCRSARSPSSVSTTLLLISTTQRCSSAT